MNDLDDELDLRFHRGLKPEVYYRCPSSESLDGALRNEFEKNAASLIPVDIVTEFVFGKASTITVPVTQQPSLDTLFEPADYPQSILVDHALCHGIEGKERFKLQRAIARCFIEAIQGIDGFKYTERQAWNKDGSDGVRFKYVCLDSLQNRDRKSNAKKENDSEDADNGRKRKRPSTAALPTYDCGGAIHVRFSTKREAVNVMYVHNPIHRDIVSRPTNDESLSKLICSLMPSGPTCRRKMIIMLTFIAISQLFDLTAKNGTETANGASDGTKQWKRKKSKNDHHVEADSAFHDPDLDMSTSPEASKASTKKTRKKKASRAEVGGSATEKKGNSKQAKSPSKARQKAPARDPSPEPVQPVKGKCLRCREKGIKCNEGKPTCNQCLRGLWTCQYEIPGPKKRSKNGCLNCRSRKRKCTEERPSCAYCLKVDDDCVYGEYA